MSHGEAISQCSPASPDGALEVPDEDAFAGAGMLPMDLVSFPAPEPECAPCPGVPQPVTPEVYVALAALRKIVLGAGKGPSDLQGGHVGLFFTVARLLEVPKWPLPAAQLDRLTMPRLQQISDGVLYAAAAALGRAHSADLEAFWCHSEHPLASLYRLVMARQFGPTYAHPGPSDWGGGRGRRMRRS